MELCCTYDGDWSDLLDSSVTHVVCFPCLGIKNFPVQLNPEQPYELITPAWIDSSIRKMKCQAEVDYRP
ncbi:hypothetical protein FGIG_10932 [Fasciola gigantica]|uniref:BRCT domain-containing protein n=1 Tax=Fasciola gigantica TaxID=46835 RepID=A0A504Z3T2_FASGI|nr:hypothetical protein FGIG_10932 [Fasciola gigantica]